MRYPTSSQTAANPDRHLYSFPEVVSVSVSFITLFLSYESPLAAVLLGLYLSSFVLPYRFERNSGNLWGIRLLAYAMVGVVGRSAVAAPDYLFDARSFATAGLVAGTEIVLQAFRRPAPRTRFDPIVFLLTGVVFLVACNTYRIHIWYLAPLYMLFTLWALTDVRERRRAFHLPSALWHGSLMFLAVVVGLITHMELWTNRGSLMALGGRLLSGTALPFKGGIADSPDLGSGKFSPANSTQRIFRIDGQLTNPHLRAAAFVRYHEGDWGPRIRSRRLGDAPASIINETSNGPFTQVTLINNTGGMLFFPFDAAALVPPEGSSFNWEAQSGPVTTEDQMPYSYYFLCAYRPGDESHLSTFQGPLSTKPSASDRPALLAIPREIDRRVVWLAQAITHRARTPLAKISAVSQYLLTHYQYSLTYQKTKQDPVSDFLLNHRSAHCQYFASAAVMLLRSVGVPARYVTGYYANEQLGRGSYVIRGRDAHAWAEAYADGVGWVTVEATPPDGRADHSASPVAWYQKLWEKVVDLWNVVRTAVGNLTPFQLGAIIVTIALLWGLERLRLRLKGPRYQFAGPVPPAHLRALAHRFERALAHRGIAPPAGRPWSEALPEDWPAASAFVAGYNRLRFADTGVPEQHEKLLRELEKEMNKIEARSRKRAPIPTLPATSEPATSEPATSEPATTGPQENGSARL